MAAATLSTSRTKPWISALAFLSFFAVITILQNSQVFQILKRCQDADMLRCLDARKLKNHIFYINFKNFKKGLKISSLLSSALKPLVALRVKTFMPCSIITCLPWGALFVNQSLMVNTSFSLRCYNNSCFQPHSRFLRILAICHSALQLKPNCGDSCGISWWCR